MDGSTDQSILIFIVVKSTARATGED